jgi:16S rRNA (guanine966-N2)-methyltransferase
MNVRIISGKFGGRLIEAPDGTTTHPMSERVRGSLFNMLGETIKNAEVLDAFAGTGSLGLEALSRGAKHATFIERDRAASDILVKNISKLNANADATVLQMNVATFITKNPEKIYDVIFTDPPYNDMQLSTVSRLVKILSPSGIMILSYPGRGEVLPINGIVVVDNRSYGTAALAFYRKE